MGLASGEGICQNLWELSGYWWRIFHRSILCPHRSTQYLHQSRKLKGYRGSKGKDPAGWKERVHYGHLGKRAAEQIYRRVKKKYRLDQWTRVFSPIRKGSEWRSVCKTEKSMGTLCLERRLELRLSIMDALASSDVWLWTISRRWHFLYGLERLLPVVWRNINLQNQPN